MSIIIFYINFLFAVLLLIGCTAPPAGKWIATTRVSQDEDGTYIGESLELLTESAEHYAKLRVLCTIIPDDTLMSVYLETVSSPEINEDASSRGTILLLGFPEIPEYRVTARVTMTSDNNYFINISSNFTSDDDFDEFFPSLLNNGNLNVRFQTTSGIEAHSFNLFGLGEAIKDTPNCFLPYLSQLESSLEFAPFQ